MTTINRRFSTEAAKPHWVEWATGAVCAVLVVAAIGSIGWEAFSENDLPPDFAVEITGRTQTGSGYRVEFDISNKATRTAAAVVVRGEILDGGQIVEDAEVTFDYVAAESKASGAVLFAQDPAAREVRIRPVGYTDP